MPPDKKILVVGVGNPDRGDDALGLLVARRVRKVNGLPAEVLELPADVSGLLQAWEGAENVVLVDAMRAGLPPGSVRRIDARRDAVAPEEFRGASTHSFGVGEAIELGRVLGRLPARLVIVGVEGARWDPGALLSSEVEAALDGAAELVLREVESCTNSH